MAVGNVARLDRQREAENDRFGGVEVVRVPFEPKQERTRLQLRALTGLVREVVRAGVDAADAILAVLQRRDEDDRDQPRRFVGFHEPADLEAGQPGHHHVQEEQIGRLARHQRQDIVAAARPRDLVTVASQDPRQEIKVRFHVVGHDDSARQIDDRIAGMGRECCHGDRHGCFLLTSLCRSQRPDKTGSAIH